VIFAKNVIITRLRLEFRQKYALKPKIRHLTALKKGFIFAINYEKVADRR
jgi:hypothetical protein